MAKQLYEVDATPATYDNLFADLAITILTKGITLKAAQGIIKRGSVLGLIALAVGTIVVGDNTGDATIAPATLATNAQLGNYKVICNKAPNKPLAVGAITPSATNTGDAAIATAVLATNAQLGTYKINCITTVSQAGADDAVFSVFAPDGSRLADATQGVEYAGGHLEFTISDATAVDSVVGDTYIIAVAVGASANDAVFSVFAPDGRRLVDAIQHVAYAGGHVVFTISNATAVDSIVGDSYTIPVIAGSGLAVLVNSVNKDGSNLADSVLSDDVDTGAAGATTNITYAAYIQGHFNRKALIFGGADTAAVHEDRLRDVGIVLKDNIAY